MIVIVRLCPALVGLVSARVDYCRNPGLSTNRPVGHGGAHGLSMVSFTPHALMSGSTTIGLLICFACFMGFEATTIYSEEANNPERTVPRATYLAVLIIGLFYAFTSWCMVNGTGAKP